MTGRASRLQTFIRKAAQISPADWRRIVRGQLALVRALWDVRTRPRGELVRRDDSRDENGSPDPQRVVRARRVALGVTRAATHGLFHPTCLVRSIALVRRLEAEGIRGSAVRVGVARRSGKFTAHAWVEIDGVVVGDDEDTADRYASLSDLQVTTKT